MNLEVNTLFVSSDGVGSSTIYAGTDGGVFLSTDNGTNWKQTNTGLASQYANALAMNGTNLYTSTENGGLFLSTNSGTSWAQLNDNSNDYVISSISITQDNGIFIGTKGGGGFHSTDNGVTWIPLWDLYGEYSFIWSIANSVNGTGGTNIFAGASYSGIKLSTDNGNSWKRINKGLDTVATFFSIIVKGNKIFAAKEFALSSFFLSFGSTTSRHWVSSKFFCTNK